jgi:uncharacterized protein YdaU (DUF1376 family)
VKYPWMPLFWGDFLANTMDLSAQEAGAYLFLIAHAWEHDGKIPGEHARLCRIAHVRQEWWLRVWKVLEKFFEPLPSSHTHMCGYTHVRVTAELHRLGKISNKRKAAAEQMHSKCIPFASTSTSITNRSSNGELREAQPVQMHGPQAAGWRPRIDDDNVRIPPAKKSDNVLQPLPDKQVVAAKRAAGEE